MAKTTTFTSESVCAGHPDKICDAISDAIVDTVLAQDPHGRVAVETMVTFNRVVIAGEVTAKAKINGVRAAKTDLFTDCSIWSFWQKRIPLGKSCLAIYLKSKVSDLKVMLIGKTLT